MKSKRYLVFYLELLYIVKKILQAQKNLINLSIELPNW